ncbi:hypothetical protein M9Y10_016987 [Tritrichomonas musculus]|uniref:Right handed beta helix domain-containing protein n=1 Tax=Tritrichomonas musculus TaxID=1915356 RepID=A0ABR2HXR1_9EUKA
MDISGTRTCFPKDPDCPIVNFSDPKTYKCGQTCWSDSGDTTFSYTFKGVQFLVYGNKSKEYKSFELYFDGKKLITINEEQEEDEPYALLYTSSVYQYGTHTITAKGIQGQKFSLFKFAFWPHLKSKRLNISEMESTGKWILESDEIGGTREYSQSQGASKSLTIEASKLWVYGTPDPGHGQLRISFNAIDQIVNTAGTRKDGTLMFESEEIPTTFHQLDLVSVDSKPVLIYCVYYLYDPPQPTRMPYPSRTPIPGTNMSFIDKTFTGSDIVQINNGQPQYKDVKQISGCTFKNIAKSRNYFIRLDSEVLFYDNRIEFDKASFDNPAPIFLTQVFKGQMTISRCTFIRCASSDHNDGNVLNIRGTLDAFIEDCRFVNCYAEGRDGQAVVQFNEKNNNLVKFTDCTFQFSTSTGACHAFNGNNSKLIFNHCTLSKCGAAILTNDVNQFEFTNNVVTSAGQDLIKIDNLLKASPIITGNTFKFNEIDSSNLITLIHTVDRIDFINNSFVSNTLIGNGKSVEGGGIGLFVKKSTDTANRLYFINCSFDENKNNYADSNSNEGGALHLGSSPSTELIIQKCQFKGNSCQQGRGAAISTTTKADVTIEDCTFEKNVAKTEGNVLYISQDSTTEVKLSIKRCNFIDNGDNQKSMISGSCVGLEFDACQVKYTNKAKASQAISLSVKGAVTLSNTDFTNCSTSSDSSVLFTQQKADSTVTISKCNFLNCKAKSFVAQITNGKSVVTGCAFTFDTNDENSAGGAVKSECNDFSCTYCTFTRNYFSGTLTVKQSGSQNGAVDISNCIFDDCGGENTRCFSITTFTTSLTFSSNEIRNMKPMKKGYFGAINPNSKIDTLEMKNITFADNVCNALFGGGSGLWVNGVKNFYFNDCKFINNVAIKDTETRISNYYAGDGGGIQYGFTESIYNINMKFENCLFSKNKAIRHGGAIALQTTGTVEIISCTFEENVANYQYQSSSSELLAENYFHLKSEGRGGAIYINPSFTDKNNKKAHMESVKIEKCTFKSNSAFDGFAIYIEGDDDGTEFSITGNKFTNNYDGTDHSNNRGVIITEIDKLMSQKIDETNTFDPYPKNLKIFPIISVDHSARTLAPTPMATPQDMDFGADQCTPGCYFVGGEEPILFKPQKKIFEDIENATGSGSAIFIENAGCLIIDSSFTNCSSPNNGGGAIYIDTEVDNVIHAINIENTLFKQCKSTCGGAVYIRSVYECSPVSIKSCIFEKNEVLQRTSRDKNDNLFGGSAAYLNVRDGTVFNCSFHHNTGKGGALKLVNNFDTDSKSVLLHHFLNRYSVVVSDCLFETDDKQTSSVFYYGGKFGSEFQISNCEFVGVLDKDAHHIDGVRTSKKAPKLTILNCKFSDDYKSSLNNKDNYLSINLKEQVFGSDSVQQKESSSFNLASVVVLAIAALLAIVAAVVVNKKPNQTTDEEKDEEMIKEEL